MKTASSLSDVARLSAERFGPHPALMRSGDIGGGGLSYAATWAAVRSGAAALRSAGLEPGDHVLLAATPQPGWVAALLAILEAGLVAVPLPADVGAERARAAARLVDARAVVVDGPADYRAVPVMPLGLLFAVEPPAKDPGTRPSRDDLAMLVFTSGSTASPRVVELTHGNVLADLEGLLALRTAAPGDAFLSMLPPSHLFELVGGVLGPLACGARVVYAGAPLPNRLVAALRREKITHALATPALLDALLREVRSALKTLAIGDDASPGAGPDHAATVLRGATSIRRDAVRGAVREEIGRSLKTLIVGGAGASPAWREVLGAVGIRLEVGYGLTEASPIVTLGAADDCPPGSVGRPLPGVTVAVGADREIVVRGPTTMRGYFRDADATRTALCDGALRTGDIGRVDENGFVFIDGRVNEAMVSATGETVWPEEMEACYASPLFAEWTVVPLRGAQGDHVPTLVARTASPRATDAEFAAETARLRAAAPPSLRFADVRRTRVPLPRTPVGKVRRRALGESLSGPTA
jgi:long-chain acyl-CoA synthetase